MDTSKEYIKMCEKAEEIQKEWIPQNGDFFFTNKVYVWGCYECKKGIWLSRQDQLQEMLDVNNSKFVKPCFMAMNFAEWLNNNIRFSNVDWSMEQLWLAFVMIEKYNKIWNSEEWVEEETK